MKQKIEKIGFKWAEKNGLLHTVLQDYSVSIELEFYVYLNYLYI